MATEERRRILQVILVLVICVPRLPAQARYGGGSGTAGMQNAKTFSDAGWDFAGETANGTENTWWIDEGKDYPRLWWEAGGE